MDYFAFSFISLLLSCILSVGRCDNLYHSLCWMFRDDFQRSDRNILLNDIALQSISKEDVFTSVTVSPNFTNLVKLNYPPDHNHEWTFSIQSTKGKQSLQVTGTKKPQIHPSETTRETMKMIAPSEVFACENGTLFFHQDESLILAMGYTLRHPVKLETRSPSMLSISWEENPLSPENPYSSTHGVTLYQPKGSSYTSRSDDYVSENYYRFTALESCNVYLACVAIADTHLFTCVSSITEPDSPRNFYMKSWNDTSITVAWEFPENSTFSLFLLTAFFLNATDHVVEERALWHQGGSLVFTLSDLTPCSRVKFGLHSVCQAGTDYSYSEMVLMDGNSVHFNIENLEQASYGPDNYTLSWTARSTSPKSTFRVYHQKALQGSTPITNFTVQGLQPCQGYLARVEARCGADNVLMSAETVAVSTGPYGVLNLTYRSQDSTVWWTPPTIDPPLEGYVYELSFDNDTDISSGLVSEPQLHLPGLAGGVAYKLIVWAECGGQWQSEPGLLCFVAVNVPAGPGDIMEELQFDFSGGPFLLMVVPWSLTGILRDPMSEPRAEMEKIVKEKLEGLLKGFSPPARVHITDFVPQDDEGKTKIMFASFDASMTDGDVLLPVGDQLDYIQSLQRSYITVTEGIIYWDGPDECVLSSRRCPPNSLCINTLGSYTCICQHGYYNIGPVLMPPVLLAERPVCNEKGLFSQHLDKFLAGSIAKAYLTTQLGGDVKVVLNDGRCSVNETDTFFYFRIPRKYFQCGTKRLVNETHTEYRVTMAVTLSKAQTIVRREHKIVWKFVYPRKIKAQSNMKPQWLNIYSVVEFDSSQVLRLSLNLYMDLEYTYRYHSATFLYSDEFMFFELAIDVNNTFASDVLLEVVSCWSTESPDPNDPYQGIILLDGCPVDDTFHWLSENGLAQWTRFSLQMFFMPKESSMYFHCLARICGPNEDCTTNCSPNSSQPLTRNKRSLSKRDANSERETVVSVGPLSVGTRAKSHVQPSSWTEHVEMIAAVVGPVGFLLLAVLGVSATKAIMTYYEKLRLQ